MKKIYWAEVCKEEGKNGFGVVFPDFPGCVSMGDTMDELICMAHEALQGHIESMQEYGDEIPEPSDYETAVKKSEDDAWMFIPVTIEMQSYRVKRINITLPEDVLSEIDNYLKDKRISRSAFLARLATQAIRTS
jgi:predicted RNase H-like HicB family nuclease